MKDIHRNIRTFRKNAGMTQEELALSAGYTDRSSIAKIEKGLVDLSQDRIEVFARIFGITPEELTGWMPEKDTSISYCVERMMYSLGWQQYFDEEGDVALIHDDVWYEYTAKDIQGIEARLMEYLRLILSEIELNGKRRDTL